MQVILATDLPYVTLHSKKTFEGFLEERITFPYTKTLGGLEYQGGTPDLVQVAPVESEIATNGGSLEVPLADTTLAFPAGTFSDTVVVRYSVQPPAPTGDLSGDGPFFNLSAVYRGTGLPAEVQPGRSYTVEIHYSDSAPVIEDTLGLYWWNAGVGAWSQEGIANSVNSSQDLLVAEVEHFSLFAVLGETLRVYLPLVIKNH